MPRIEPPPSATSELRMYWTAASELASARRSHQRTAIRHASEELAAIAIHTGWPALRNAAIRLLAS